jgi:hypothetical protein
MAVTKEEIDLIVRQVTQAVTQQVVEQTLQAAQQTGGSLSADKKVLGSTDVTEDTQTDEAIRGKSYVDSELWGGNKKLLFSDELNNQRALNALAIKEKELQIAEREIKLKLQAQLDHIAVTAATNAGIFNHALNMEYAKFNAAISEPLAPNTADSASKKGKKVK